MTIPQQISFVSLGAWDVGALRRFYAAWGWQERDRSSDKGAQFQVGSVRLALYPIEVLGDQAAPGAEPAGKAFWKGFTLAINMPTREAVDEAFRIATEAGATVVTAPEDRFWGGYSGFLADPEGNRWEIAWAPGAG